ncbi:MAG TPA: nucleotide exchange factor GrpE [Actinomycetota bacterium]|nr:nucleotide exchange factor GrpE [Actinomycetota bacterium]
MTEEPRRIPVVDKRVSSQPDTEAAASSEAGLDAHEEPLIVPEGSGGSVVGRTEVVEEQNDFLDDLKRLQADFDNYRKRMMREQSATATRTKARFIEQLLPVLDAFDRALEHEGPSSGMELIYKQLLAVLEAEGLEEIPAQDVSFDPHVHEAIDSREDPDVEEIVCRSVHRRGYRVGDQVLRAAMVVVARPPESGSSEQEIPEAGD